LFNGQDQRNVKKKLIFDKAIGICVLEGEDLKLEVIG